MVAITLSTICFLALSGLMAAVDAAVLSVTHPEIEVMKKESKWGAHRLSRVKHDLARAVVVIVILSNTVNVLGPILVSVQAFNLYGREGLAVITVVLATGTIVFSEIVPKSLGAHYAPLIARLSAPAILTCQYLLYPLVAGFAWALKPVRSRHAENRYRRADSIVGKNWTPGWSYRTGRKSNDPSCVCAQRQNRGRDHDTD